MFTDIENRKPVWSAISELWLDTELQDHELDWIANILVKSGYSTDALRAIYEHEVAPIVYLNLLVSVGVWSGFDEKWLHEKIIASLKKKTILDRIKTKLFKRLMFSATEKYWEDIIFRIETKRATHTE